jgi:hypothetical protein
MKSAPGQGGKLQIYPKNLRKTGACLREGCKGNPLYRKRKKIGEARAIKQGLIP